MRTSFALMLVLGVISQAKSCLCECGAAPTLSINSNTVTVSGQAVHLSGKLPSDADRWFYSVRCHPSSRLFDFSLWTIDKFADQEDRYRAISWNVQVLDSKEYPEHELIFDHENSFYFRGNVASISGVGRIRVDSIVGLPKQLHGAIVLHEIKEEKKPPQ